MSQQIIELAQGPGQNMIKRLAPFGLQMLVSATAYTAGLGVFQVNIFAQLLSPRQYLDFVVSCSCLMVTAHTLLPVHIKTAAMLMCVLNCLGLQCL